MEGKTPKGKKSEGMGRRLGWWMTMLIMLGIREHPDMNIRNRRRQRSARSERLASSGEMRFRYPVHIRFFGRSRNKVVPLQPSMAAETIDNPKPCEKNPPFSNPILGINSLDILEGSHEPKSNDKDLPNGVDMYWGDEKHDDRETLDFDGTDPEELSEVAALGENHSIADSSEDLAVPDQHLDEEGWNDESPQDLDRDDKASSVGTHAVKNPVFRACFLEDMSDDYHPDDPVEELAPEDPLLPQQESCIQRNLRVQNWAQETSHRRLNPAIGFDNFPKLFATRNLASLPPLDSEIHKAMHSLITFSTKPSSSFYCSDDSTLDSVYMEEIDELLKDIEERSEDYWDENETLNRFNQVPSLCEESSSDDENNIASAGVVKDQPGDIPPEFGQATGSEMSVFKILNMANDKGASDGEEGLNDFPSLLIDGCVGDESGQSETTMSIQSNTDSQMPSLVSIRTDEQSGSEGDIASAVKGSGDTAGVFASIESPVQTEEEDGGGKVVPKKRGRLLRYLNRKCARVAMAIGSLTNIRPPRKVAPEPWGWNEEEEDGVVPVVRKDPTKPGKEGITGKLRQNKANKNCHK